MKITILTNYASWWINEDSRWKEMKCIKKQKIINEFPVIAGVVNNFPKQSGPNCLAATAI